MEEFFEDATLQYEDFKRIQSGLNADYQRILDLQEEYSFELVNNDAFLDWTTSDWKDSWEAQTNPNATEPYLDWGMKESFISAPNGSGSKNLRTIQQVDQAMSNLYWFRNRNGLEDDVSYNYYDEYYYVSGEWWFEDCSQNTQSLGYIYDSYY